MDCVHFISNNYFFQAALKENLPLLSSFIHKSYPFLTVNGPFAAEHSRGTKSQTGEPMTHLNMLNEENSNLVALFNISRCIICPPVWRFCTT